MAPFSRMAEVAFIFLIQDLVNTADKDGTGFIDLPGFLSLMVNQTLEDGMENAINETFKIFDRVIEIQLYGPCSAPPPVAHLLAVPIWTGYNV